MILYTFNNIPLRKSKDEVYEFTLCYGIQVVQFKRLDHYWAVLKKEGTPIEKRRFYDLSTGIIRKEVNVFCNVLTGITKEYDESGTLIKEINEDEAYQFTIDDVVKFVKRETGVDMTKMEDNFDKNIYKGGGEYVVYIKDLSSALSIRRGGYDLEIDGLSGEILYYKKKGVELINKGEPRPVIF